MDEYSFGLGNFDGTVGAFCDVIMAGTKDLAFSDPFCEDEPVLTPMWPKKCENYGVVLHRQGPAADQALLPPWTWTGRGCISSIRTTPCWTPTWP